MIFPNLMGTVLNLIPWSLRRHIKHIPGIAKLQRHLVSTLLDKREFTHVVDAGPAKGMSFVVRLPEDKGIWTGTYEFELATRLAAAVRPGTIGYDIGSWHGFFAGVMSANGAREVHVFEPLPVNADRIRQLIELNPTKVIMLHPVAVGESDMEMDLMIMRETSMAKLEVSGFQPSATPQRKIRVHVRSLDSMLFGGEVPPPSLLKIDVEGAELAVLQGARATLRAHRPEIFAEIHSATLLEQCTLFLTGEGYRTESLNSAVAQSKEIYQIRAFAG